MDVRVSLDDERVVALVADRVESLSFSDDVDLVAVPSVKRSPSELDGVLIIVAVIRLPGAFPHGGHQNQEQKHRRAVPRRHVGGGERRRRR